MTPGNKSAAHHDAAGTPAPRPLRALLVEDNRDDADLAVLELQRAGFAVDPAIVDGEASLRAELQRRPWDVVLCDHLLPGFTDAEALQVLRELAPDLPLILVSGKIGEEAAAGAIRAGAWDFVAKDRLGNLGPAVERTLREAEMARQRRAAEAALRESEARFQAFVDTTPDAITLMEALRDEQGTIVDFRIQYINEAGAAMTGETPPALVGRTLRELVPRPDEAMLERYRRMVDTGEPLRYEDTIEGRTSAGEPAELILDVNLIKVGDGCGGTARDITERKRAEQERERLHARLSRLYELVITANSSIVRAPTTMDLFRDVCRAAGEVGGFSMAWLGLLDEDGSFLPVAAWGIELRELRERVMVVAHTGAGPAVRAIIEGRPFVVNDVADEDIDPRWRSVADDYGIAASAAFPLRDGERIIGAWVIHSPTVGWFNEQEIRLFEQLTDDIGLAIAARRQDSELRSTEQFLEAITDSMTEGLLALDAAGALTYMNRAAEQLLGWSADDLLGRPVDAVVHHHPDPDAAADCPLGRAASGGAPELIDDDLFVCRDGSTLPVSYSVSPLVEQDASGAVVVFSDITERKVQEQRRLEELETLSWVGRIREALDQQRLVLYRQPIMELRTRRVVSHELLLRMVDAGGAIIEPACFLPAAERFGLIGEIDLWVVGEAVKLAVAGQRVNFNLSAHSLARRDVMGRIERLLAGCGAAENLVCEVTETAIAADMGSAEAAVHQLARSGCTIALDDFGTGYGGFTYLKRLPVRHIKIDLEFVRNLRDSAENQHVVQAIVNLAQGFTQTTTAEGVEDEATLDLLAELGVDFVQGYAIGRPSPMANPSAPGEIAVR